MSAPRYHVLLELQYASSTYRISDASFDVPDASTGDTLTFSSGFDNVTMQQAMSFLDKAPAGASVPVQAVLPVDAAELYAAGWHFARSPATLSVWLEGTDYSQRTVLINGIVTGPSWRFAGDPISFSIQLPESTYVVEYPPLTQQVTGDTVGQNTVLTLSLDDLGVVYPTVFGSPGKTGNTTWVPATQGVWAIHQGEGAGGPLNYLRLILAGHHVTGKWVTLTGDVDLNPNGHRFPVYNTFDLLGQPVAMCWEGVDWLLGVEPKNVLDATGNNQNGVDANPESAGHYYGLGEQKRPNVADLNPNLDPTLYQPSTVVPAAATPSNPVTTPTTSSLFAAWREYTSSTYTGDGIVGLSPLAGDIITYMLERAGLTVDYGRMLTAAKALNLYRFDCVIDSRVKPLEWLESSIMPFIPASMIYGVDGWYVVVWRQDATVVDATAALDVSTDSAIRLVGDVDFDSDVVNQCSLQYQYDVQHSKYTSTIWRGGRPNDQPAASSTVDTGVTTYDPSQDAYSRISQAVFGVQNRSYTSANIYDSATAGRVLADKIRAFSQPRMRATYTVPRSYGLELGQVVTMSDPQLALSKRVALVEQLEIDSTGLDGVRLLFIADPLRDS